MSVAGSVEPSRSSPDAFTLENEQKDEKKQQPGGSLMPVHGINSLQRGPSHDNIDISYHRVHLSSHFLVTIEAKPSCIFSNVNANPDPSPSMQCKILFSRNLFVHRDFLYFFLGSACLLLSRLHRVGGDVLSIYIDTDNYLKYFTLKQYYSLILESCGRSWKGEFSLTSSLLPVCVFLSLCPDRFFFGALVGQMEKRRNCTKRTSA